MYQWWSFIVSSTIAVICKLKISSVRHVILWFCKNYTQEILWWRQAVDGIYCRTCMNDSNHVNTLGKLLCELWMCAVNLCTQCFSQLGSVGVTWTQIYPLNTICKLPNWAGHKAILMRLKTKNNKVNYNYNQNMYMYTLLSRKDFPEKNLEPQTHAASHHMLLWHYAF